VTFWTLHKSYDTKNYERQSIPAAILNYSCSIQSHQPKNW